jgi:hypothetical protein
MIAAAIVSDGLLLLGLLLVGFVLAVSWNRSKRPM